jgi:hypothetical protein
MRFSARILNALQTLTERCDESIGGEKAAGFWQAKIRVHVVLGTIEIAVEMRYYKNQRSRFERIKAPIAHRETLAKPRPAIHSIFDLTGNR